MRWNGGLYVKREGLTLFSGNAPIEIVKHTDDFKVDWCWSMFAFGESDDSIISEKI